jgi:4-hydroxybenzoate polyprenyltransferase
MFAFLKILRPINLFFLAFALTGLLLVVVSFSEATKDLMSMPIGLGILFIYVFCSAMAGGYVINDIFDLETDKINKPGKNVIGIHLTLRQAKGLYLALCIDTTLFAALTYWLTESVFFFASMLLIQLSLFLYAKYLKKSLLIGNMLVALLTASPYLVFAEMFQLDGVFKHFALYLALFAFLLNLLREITKDWEDIPGDEAIGANTFPIRFGISSTKKLLLALGILSFLVHILVILKPLLHQLPLKYCIEMALPVVVVAAMHMPLLLFLAKRGAQPKLISRFIKLMMFVGVLWAYYLYALG